MDIQKLAERNRIFTCRVGSHGYGLNIATSDEDFRGVFIGDPANVYGLFPVEHCEYSGDYMVYELRKFIHLARECNPNIIELLFMDPSDVLFSTPQWEKIASQRELFLSRKARFTFTGYATAQMKRIRGHNKWLNNPQPEEPPSPAKYLKRKYIEGLGEHDVFDEAAYDTSYKHWKQYWEWRKNRNEQRAELEAEHGFDSKHGMHLIRLLRMGLEIMSGQGVIVKRPDRDELLAIRNGEVSFEELVKMAEDYEKRIDALYDSSPLPKAPDVDKINQLLIEIYESFWSSQKI